MAEKMAELLAEAMEKRIAERMAEGMAERMAERIAQRMAMRMTERIVERMTYKVAERMVDLIAERTVERTFRDLYNVQIYCTVLRMRICWKPNLPETLGIAIRHMELLGEVPLRVLKLLCPFCGCHGSYIN
jgi:hypothetical protein